MAVENMQGDAKPLLRGKPVRHLYAARTARKPVVLRGVTPILWHFQMTFDCPVSSGWKIAGFNFQTFPIKVQVSWFRARSSKGNVQNRVRLMPAPSSEQGTAGSSNGKNELTGTR